MNKRAVVARDGLADLVQEMLVELGEDIGREGLKRTPERVAASLRFLTRGYKLDVDQIINNAVYQADYDEMVLVKDIEVYSLCEHHLLPFYGRCHIAYLPNNKIIGLSKMPRIVDVFSRRLQVQERLTTDVAYAIEKHLERLFSKRVMEGPSESLRRCHLPGVCPPKSKRIFWMSGASILVCFRRLPIKSAA